MTADLEVPLGRPAAPMKAGFRLGAAGWIGVVLVGMLLVSLVRVWTGADNLTSTGAVQSALTAAVPIALAGLSGLWSERAGVVNIGIEGMMVLGTFGCGWIGYQWGPWAGVLCGILCGALGGALHGLATITFGVDHIISGVAINIVAPGITLFLARLLFTNAPGGGQKQSPPISDVARITVPGLTDALGTLEGKKIFFVSDLAGIVRGVTTGLSMLTVLAVVLIVGSTFLLWRTRFGLRLRSVGEAPYAAESLGVNVYRYKYAAVVISGGLAGLAGAFLVVGLKFQDGQTGGRGFIGLASMIFGNWRPGGLAGGAALFGYTDAIQLRGSDVRPVLLIVGLLLLGLAVLALRQRAIGRATVTGVLGVLIGGTYFLIDTIPQQFTSATPYVTTLLVLGLASQRLRAPAAIGRRYARGEGG